MTATETAGTEAPEYPPPNFPYRAYGVGLTWMGEDGGMAAPGHIPDLRFIAACNRMARIEGGYMNIYDAVKVSFDDARADVRRLWAVLREPGPESDWAASWDGVTEETPGAFPMTVIVL